MTAPHGGATSIFRDYATGSSGPLNKPSKAFIRDWGAWLEAVITEFDGVTPSANGLSVLQAADYAAIRALLGVISTSVSLGAIGTYGMFDAGSLTYAPGDLIAGSSLKWASSSDGGHDISGASPSGTWRAHAYKSSSATRIGLFYRVS